MSTAIQTTNLLNLLSTSKLKVLGDGIYSFKNAKTIYIIEVLQLDIEEKKITIRHNHSTYSLVFKDELDLVLDKMGIKRSVEKVNKDVKAPMPGKVIEIMAEEGDKLEKGDGILILEAMKMENVIKAEASCTIKKILVSNLDNVEKNQVLIELEPII